MSVLISTFVFIAIILLVIILAYNSLIKYKNNVLVSLSNIETSLKQRYDLLPNLVEIVKGYSEHEYKTLTDVIKARNISSNNTSEDVKSLIKQDNMLTGALKSVFALSESYPDLKANEQYLKLQNEIVALEDKIKASRRGYNMEVRHYNEKVAIFPMNILAKLFNFKEYPYFEMNQEEAQKAYEAPKINFSK